VTAAVQLYPHAFSGLLGLRLDDFDDPEMDGQIEVVDLRRTDGAAEMDEADEPYGYDAFSKAGNWKKLTCRLSVSLRVDELAQILPATSDLQVDAALFVLVTCPATKFRHGVRLATPTTDGDSTRWKGYLTITREDVRGAVSLKPQLVRLTSIPLTEEIPFGTQAGTLIGAGPAVQLYVDLTPRLLHSTVITTWDDFGNSNDIWRREHPEDIYHLEPFGEPRLYLNSRYTQLRAILDSAARRGPEAALRDLIAAMIAQTVHAQLLTTALMSLEIDEDSGSVTVPAGWRADLLSSALGRLYPEEADDEERRRRAAHEVREADAAASIQSRVGSVVQAMITSYRTLESSIRTYESIQAREEPSGD
jgi:hypothetical protein